MCPPNSAKSLICELLEIKHLTPGIFRLDFAWQGPMPRAGQFFMVKPKRTSHFLGRPLSAAGWREAVISFLVAVKGKGTAELAALRIGDEAELTGPLGNAWADFLPKGEKPAALVGGGIGIAPLLALTWEMQDAATGDDFHFYAGFKKSFRDMEFILGSAAKRVIATEDGKTGLKGKIVDFLEARNFRAVLACGPQAMLKAIKSKCEAAGVPCFLSLERRMACGVGACLGCTVRTVNGNRRCCKDGPIFAAGEIVFDE